MGQPSSPPDPSPGAPDAQAPASERAAGAPAPVDAERLRAHRARVASRAVQDAIARVLKRRVPAQDRGAVASNVWTALLEMKDPPLDEGGCVAAGIDLARKKAADHVRGLGLARRRRHDRPAGPAAGGEAGEEGDRDAELAAEADAMPLAPAYAVHEEKHRTVEAAIADGTVAPRTARAMQMQAEGHRVAAIARALGVAESTVHRLLSEGRKDVRAAWRKRAAALGLLGVLALFAVLAAERERIADWMQPAPPMVPDITPPAPPVTPEMRAAELRRRARGECAAELYMPCETHLDEAKALDPAGDTSPEVRAMRDAIRGPVPPPLPVRAPLDGKKGPRNPRLK